MTYIERGSQVGGWQRTVLARRVLIPLNRATLRQPVAILDATASASYGVKIAKVQFVLTGGTYKESVIGTASYTVVGWLVVWNNAECPRRPIQPEERG